MATVDIHAIRDFEAGNPKDRTPEDIAMLDASLAINGYAMPLLVREAEPGSYELLDGHGRVGRIREKYPEVRELKVIVLDVESVAEGRKLILGLQNTARFDMDALDAWVQAGLDEGIHIDEVLELGGFTLDDLNSIASAHDRLAAELERAEDAEPAAAEEDDLDPTPTSTSSISRAARVFVFEKEKLAAAAFAHYRREGFPYPNPSPTECMLSINKLASMPADALLRTHDGGPAADKFQPHRFAAVADGMVSPLAAFNDDKKLRYVIDMIIDSAGTIGDGSLRSMLGMVQGAQSCSNFRPGFAAHLYRRFVPPGGTVLDTSAGFGGRLVGALASTVVGRYIGIDPNTPSIEGSRKLLALLDRSDFAEFVELPAEDIDPNRWADQCDFMFTSPPYFNKEVYSDAPTQSGNRYPEADAWREKFLYPMLKLTFASLKPGAHAGINIADSMVGKIRHPLGDWTVAEAKRAGFEHMGALDFPVGGGRNFGGMKGTQKQEDSTSEPIFLFRKPVDAKPAAAPAPKKPRTKRP